MKPRKGNVLKTFVFIVCTLSAIILGLSVLLEIGMYVFDFYTNDVNSLYFDILSPYYGNGDLQALADASRPGGAYRFLWLTLLTVYDLRYWMYLITLAALIFTGASFVWLMNISGKRPGEEGVFPGPFNKIPTDVLLVLDALLIAIPWGVWDGEVAGYAEDIINILAASILSIYSFCIFLGLCMDIAARIKEHSIVHNTVIAKLVKYLLKGVKWLFSKLKKGGNFLLSLFRGLPMIWRTALVLFGCTVFDGFMIFMCWHEMDNYFIYFIFKTVIVVPAIMFAAISLRRLQAQGEELAKGNLSHQLDTTGLFWDLKLHGDNLNSIAKGMTIAVNDRLKSERMKTELITNVSHDIKTPLTSIINYAALIAEEPTDNENIKEYSEVLLRQSGRLKHLIEDLVEASKAATGNLEVNLEPCEAAVFITQIAGEYEEKLEKSGLSVISKVPEEEVKILADGRRMLRVFDNLLNNICKYSLEGSRVYLSLAKVNNRAVFTFKNTSKAELNISEDELIERFTRGDSSRNTEGNGLGLSIAKSITELQNGEFKLTVDGDLFKVELSFPAI